MVRGESFLIASIRPWIMALAVVLSAASLAQEEIAAYSGVTESRLRYQEHCAVCHGENLEGAAQGTSLRADLSEGESVDEIAASIAVGSVSAGMPAWRATFSPIEIKGIALYILEARADINYASFNYDTPMSIPSTSFKTEWHDFRLASVADGLDPLPYSIAPLPNGELLVVEKTRGVRIVTAAGAKSELIAGTPVALHNIFRIEGLDTDLGEGWLFDIAVHPDYVENGWVYLAHSHRCERCNRRSREHDRGVSMNRLVRGRIAAGVWTDEQVIWQARLEDYMPTGDYGAGGRIAFDDRGHVFLSIGMKCGFIEGIQDLRAPCGKVHRVHDDGRIPIDNPFVSLDGVYPSTYTYGHRTPQGLEFDRGAGGLWGTEHGPRGGDEINHLRPGRNYGWPLTSLGTNYDGSPVDYGAELDIDIEGSAIEQPIVDLSPSPAVSSFIIADSDQFPEWRGDFIVGSLKARSLLRVRLDGTRLLDKETLIKGVGRIRDIEQGSDGTIYLLLEDRTGGKIIRLERIDRHGE